MVRREAIHLCPQPTPEMMQRYKVVEGIAEVPFRLSTLETRLCSACNSVVTGFYFKEEEAIAKWKLNQWEAGNPLVLRQTQEIIERKKF